MQDRENKIQEVAKFIGIDCDAELLALAMEQSSKAFMAAHVDKYDDHPGKLRLNEKAGLPRHAGLGESGSVRPYRVQSGPALNSMHSKSVLKGTISLVASLKMAAGGCEQFAAAHQRCLSAAGHVPDLSACLMERLVFVEACGRSEMRATHKQCKPVLEHSRTRHKLGV